MQNSGRPIWTCRCFFLLSGPADREAPIRAMDRDQRSADSSRKDRSILGREPVPTVQPGVALAVIDEAGHRDSAQA